MKSSKFIPTFSFLLLLNISPAAYAFEAISCMQKSKEKGQKLERVKLENKISKTNSILNDLDKFYEGNFPNVLMD